jgi:hypothetical protein
MTNYSEPTRKTTRRSRAEKSSNRKPLAFHESDGLQRFAALAKPRAKGAQKNYLLLVIRALTNYVFNVISGARSIHLPWASR